MKVYWLQQCASDVPSDNDWLSASENERLSGIRFPKRRADWRLGRWTAKNAVAACLNWPSHPTATMLARVAIVPAESGAPQVFLAGEPAAISISISHRDGIAVS